MILKTITQQDKNHIFNIYKTAGWWDNTTEDLSHIGTGLKQYGKGLWYKVKGDSAQDAQKRFNESQQKIQQMHQNGASQQQIQAERQRLQDHQNRMYAMRSNTNVNDSAGLAYQNINSHILSTGADALQFVTFGETDKKLKQFRKQQEQLRQQLAQQYNNINGNDASNWWAAGDIAARVASEALMGAATTATGASALRYAGLFGNAMKASRLATKGIRQASKLQNYLHRAGDIGGKIFNYGRPATAGPKLGFGQKVWNGTKFLARQTAQDIGGAVIDNTIQSVGMNFLKDLPPQQRQKAMRYWRTAGGVGFASPNILRGFTKGKGFSPVRALMSTAPQATMMGVGGWKAPAQFTKAEIQQDPSLLYKFKNVQQMDPASLNAGARFAIGMNDYFNNFGTNLTSQIISTNPTLSPLVMFSMGRMGANAMSGTQDIDNSSLSGLMSNPLVANNMLRESQVHGASISDLKEGYDSAGKELFQRSKRDPLLQQYANVAEATAAIISDKDYVAGIKQSLGYNPYTSYQSGARNNFFAKPFLSSAFNSAVEEQAGLLKAISQEKDPKKRQQLTRRYHNNQYMTMTSQLSKMTSDRLQDGSNFNRNAQNALFKDVKNTLSQYSLQDLSAMARTKHQLDSNSPIKYDTESIKSAYDAQIDAQKRTLEYLQESGAPKGQIYAMQDAIAEAQKQRQRHLNSINAYRDLTSNTIQKSLPQLTNKVNSVLQSGESPYQVAQQLMSLQLLADEGGGDSAQIAQLKDSIKGAVWKDLKQNPGNLNKAVAIFLKSSFGKRGGEGGFINTVANGIKDPWIGYGVPVAATVLGGMAFKGNGSQEASNPSQNMSDYQYALQNAMSYV